MDEKFPPPPRDSLSLGQEQAIHQLCDRFERALRQVASPRIEAYLDQLPEPAKPLLLRELLEVEIEQQKRAGAVIDFPAYRQRFPKHVRVIDEVAAKLKAADGEHLQYSTLAELHGAAISTEQFVRYLTDSGLMSRIAVMRFQESLSKPCRNGKDLALSLVQKKHLTRFQAQQIYAGKYHHLMLGEYLICDYLGAGGMGTVYLAEHRRMKRTVALKALSESIANNPLAVQRFHREMRAAAKLSHINIVTAYDAGEAKGIHYFVMEHVSGTDLSKLIHRSGPVSVMQAIDFTLQAARGLHHAHVCGVVHRDIKPSNILLDNGGVIKILDMGIARIDAEPEEATTSLTQAGNIMGTAAYMAPEQALETKIADHRSDIYSLGCVLYFLLTGRKVYDGDTTIRQVLAHRDNSIPSLMEVRADVSPSLDAVFQKMVAKRPEQRQQTAHELIAELDTCRASVSAGEKKFNGAAKPAFSTPTRRDLEVSSVAETVDASSKVLQEETIPSTATNQMTARRVGEHQIRSQIPPSRSNRPTLIGGTTFGFLILLAGIILRVETPVGTVVLELDQPELAGATVTVDDQQKITLQTGAGRESIEVEADDETHTLKITKDGFEVFTKDFTMKSGGRQTLRVRMERLPVPAGREPATARIVQEDTELPPGKNLSDTSIHRDRNVKVLSVCEAVWKLGGEVLSWNESKGQHFKLTSESETFPEGGMTLVFKGVKHFGDAELSQVAELCRSLNPHMTISFDLSGTQVSPRGIHYLADLPIFTLLLNRNPRIDDEVASALAKCTYLDTLGLQETRVTDATIQALVGIETLTVLNVSHTSVTEKIVPELATLSLRQLDITQTRMDETSVAELRSAMPGCTIAWNENAADSGGGPSVYVRPSTGADSDSKERSGAGPE